MKLITAVIKPFKLEETKEALVAIGVSGVTAIELGAVAVAGSPARPPDPDEGVVIVPKAGLEIVVADDLVARAVEVIMRSAATGRPGDGHIAVAPVEQAVRIRTGERDEDAL